MDITRNLSSIACVAGLALAVGAVGLGCSQKKGDDKGQQKPATHSKPAAPLVPTVQAIDWCREHCVPESICAQCNDSLAAGYKAKGDWCKEHNVPDSQCFKCHPELKEKFAAAFKGKYGKEPPAESKE